MSVVERALRGVKEAEAEEAEEDGEEQEEEAGGSGRGRQGGSPCARNLDLHS